MFLPEKNGVKSFFSCCNYSLRLNYITVSENFHVFLRTSR